MGAVRADLGVQLVCEATGTSCKSTEARLAPLVVAVSGDLRPECYLFQSSQPLERSPVLHIVECGCIYGRCNNRFPVALTDAWDIYERCT